MSDFPGLQVLAERPPLGPSPTLGDGHLHHLFHRLVGCLRLQETFGVIEELLTLGTHAEIKQLLGAKLVFANLALVRV